MNKLVIYFIRFFAFLKITMFQFLFSSDTTHIFLFRSVRILINRFLDWQPSISGTFVSNCFIRTVTVTFSSNRSSYRKIAIILFVVRQEQCHSILHFESACADSLKWCLKGRELLTGGVRLRACLSFSIFWWLSVLNNGLCLLVVSAGTCKV